MRPKPLHAVVVLVLAACGAVGLTGLASARVAADSIVTIQVEGRDFSGKVKSDRQSCVTDRKVILLREVGGAQGGGDDIRIATDTASEDGEWSTGNTGQSGKFYARVRRIEGLCRPDTSRTLRTEAPIP